MTLDDLLQEMRSHPGRLALVLAGPGEGALMDWMAEQLQEPVTSVGKLVTSQPDFPSQESVASLLAEVTLLGDLDVLFWPDLRIDPLRLLRFLARSRPRIVSWPGPIRGSSVLYSEPGRPDYFEATLSDAVILEEAPAPRVGEAPFVERRIT